MLNRRRLLQAVPALAGSAMIPQSRLSAQNAEFKGRLRPGLVAYSFRGQLAAKKMSYEDLIRYAAGLGFEGLDTTVYWFPDTSDQFLANLRRTAYRNGISLYSVAARVRLCQPTSELRVGGAWAWHQDYGYWYENGVLFPLLASAFIAVDPATRENGCLQVLERSHRMGRINHVLTGDQAGADRERVEEATKRLPLVYVEMDPGDVLFFDCNLLHRSDQNRSPNPRWSMICCYNAARNDPYKESHHPRYTPLAKVADSSIRAAGVKRFAEASTQDVAWLDPQKDHSASRLSPR